MAFQGEFFLAIPLFLGTELSAFRSEDLADFRDLIFALDLIVVAAVIISPQLTIFIYINI